MTIILSPKLREYLPKKWNETVAQKYDVSQSYVRRIYRGELKYSDKVTEITKSIVALAEDNKAKADALARDIEARQQNIFTENEY